MIKKFQSFLLLAALIPWSILAPKRKAAELVPMTRGALMEYDSSNDADDERSSDEVDVDGGTYALMHMTKTARIAREEELKQQKEMGAAIIRSALQTIRARAEIKEEAEREKARVEAEEVPGDMEDILAVLTSLPHQPMVTAAAAAAQPATQMLEKLAQGELADQAPVRKNKLSRAAQRAAKKMEKERRKEEQAAAFVSSVKDKDIDQYFAKCKYELIIISPSFLAQKKVEATDYAVITITPAIIKLLKEVKHIAHDIDELIYVYRTACCTPLAEAQENELPIVLPDKKVIEAFLQSFQQLAEYKRIHRRNNDKSRLACIKDFHRKQQMKLKSKRALS